MDSLTHLVAGALTPLAFPGAPRRAALLAFGIVVGELPDIDVVFGSAPEALMLIHRGITHSLLWQPVLALLAVLPFYLWLRCKTAQPAAVAVAQGHSSSLSYGRKAFAFQPVVRGQQLPRCPGAGRFAFSHLYMAALFALYTHIYLDCMTSFGTRVFLPFSSARVGFPSMFIVDLLLTLPALALMLHAWRLKPDCPAASPDALAGAGPDQRGILAPGMFVSAGARRIARIALAWILIYPLLSLGLNAAVTRHYAPALAPEGSLKLLTEPFSPFVWKAVIADGHSYRMGVLNIFSSQEPSFQTFARPEPLLYETLKRQQEIFRQFEEFSSFMVQMERPASYLTQMDYQENIREYAFVDLRYLIAANSPARFFGRKDPNFILEARINDSGALLAYRFLRRGMLTSTPWIRLQ
jgi:inner membrane protein